MEEKDINSIASAVTNALSKLNADTAAHDARSDESQVTDDKLPKDEVFRCPECDALVKGGIDYCQSCGCALEWER